VSFEAAISWAARTHQGECGRAHSTEPCFRPARRTFAAAHELHADLLLDVLLEVEEGRARPAASARRLTTKEIGRGRKGEEENKLVRVQFCKTACQIQLA
jgi:hypothetical protein